MNKFSTEQKLVPLVSIEKNKWNPNIQNEVIKNKLKKSIKEHGFTCPILVRRITDSTYEIIDGEHRWSACKELGFDVIRVEDMGEVEDSVAKVLTIALNNIKGEDDILKRAEILKQLSEGQLSLLPWDEKEIQNELDLIDFDWDKFNEKEDDIKEKKSQTFIFNLTEKEYAVVQLAIKLTSSNNLNESFLEIVKEYLELRTDITKYEEVFDRKRSEMLNKENNKNMSEETKEEATEEETKEETEESTEETSDDEKTEEESIEDSESTEDDDKKEEGEEKKEDEEKEEEPV